ncbi:UNC93-like protein MFSD11 isoform X2 [Myxocyprinus asiaticus]|uniref:UNC93-like protein MFSD11 isoform X2 n=1 Tax=Myxocyprinus asiaticus TaxID=70543 RepID=UPI0022225A1F|nr:UNC93-like protein MFSD11 isoform X2 [Myxocyprinus asiaticus]
MADIRTYNVVILGIGFLLIFTAFTTCGNIEQTVVKSLNNTTFSGSGYHSLGIIYGVFSFCNLLAPTIVAITGPQLTMFLSGILYSGYIAVFIIPSTWSFYFTSVLIGIGAAMLWTAQGHVLLENSDTSTINRNTGMFWALLQCRYKQRVTSAVTEAKTEFKTILDIFRTKTILLLSFCMAYSGLELSFYSGVYGTCIGATTHFGEAAKGLIGISGIVVGIGEIVGGGLFGLVLKNNRFRRTSVVFLGMVVHFVAFYLIFLNIPDDAPVVLKTSSQHKPYMAPSVSIALLCSFLLGLGDSCFNTQLYSILGRVYVEHSAPAFAIFKFTQSIFAAVAFFYSGYVLLTWQLLIMVIMGFTGTLCFFIVERLQNVSADTQEY